MKKIIVGLVLILVLFACSSSKNEYVFNSEEIIDKEIFETYLINPSNKEAKGQSVSFSAQIFNISDEDDDFIYYQVEVDPIAMDQDLVVIVDKDEEKFKNEDVLKVEGVIVGELSGTNAFGTDIKSLAVKAENIERISFVEAFLPSIQTININKSQEQNDFKVTVEKIEFSEYDTRLYLSAENNSQDEISFYSFNTKIVAGDKNYEESMNFFVDYPELASELSPNTVTEGVLAYDKIDFEKIETLKIIVDEPYSDNWDVDFEDYIFEIDLS